MNSADLSRGGKNNNNNHPCAFVPTFVASKKVGNLTSKRAHIERGNLIQKLILVRANKQTRMSIGLYVHSSLRILDLSAFNVIRFCSEKGS